MIVGGVGRSVVNVDGDAVDRAIGTVVQKVGEPACAHGWSAVRDRRRTKFGFPGERLHVRLPSLSGSARVDIGLGVQVWLVETDDEERTVTISNV